ncbi:MAG: hypothetical protein M1831_004822 [Alyxoria varia]|nr:MAG: hypothetical protein M1831_004822 [Alyxoria varia]
MVDHIRRQNSVRPIAMHGSTVPQKEPGSAAGDNADDNAERVGPKQPRNDSFYKLWDKFTAESAKSKKSTASTPPSPPPRPLDLDANGHPTHNVHKNREGVRSKESAATSFDEATASCKSKVRAIVAECHRLNKRYFDPVFNLGTDESLESLQGILNSSWPESTKDMSGVAEVKRVGDIFDKPQFIIDGATASDVRQGTTIADCWFLAAVSALSGSKDLLMRLCVDRDEQAGVYGFVFFRDGEWTSTVIDDRLCVKISEDQRRYLLHVWGDKRIAETEWKDLRTSDIPKKQWEALMKGNDALFFSSCKEDEETWLPLMEKAYAKAHGDYQCIEYGFSGEGIEDLTGGVNNFLEPEDILNKDRFWKELLQVNEKFLFGCGSRRGNDSNGAPDKEGFVRSHAYTVLEAKEIKRQSEVEKDGKRTGETKEEVVRLLKIRNPWGRVEWNGAWSDGSKEWTPKIMKELDHTFGDDGIFWISYEDFLKYYRDIDRTRLFGAEWTMLQQWTSLEVPRTTNHLDTDYQNTQFLLQITKPGPVVIVLQKPDQRYFVGLEGRYYFDLHFRLYEDGQETYLVRSMQKTASGRSCSVELDLEPGSYTIRMKIMPSRNDTDRTPEDVIRKLRTERRSKLLAIGQNFDQVQSKGRLREAERAASRRMKVESWKEGEARRKSKRLQVKEERRRNKLRRDRTKAELKKKKLAKQAEARAAREAKKPVFSNVPPQKATAEKGQEEEVVPSTEGHVESSSSNSIVEVTHPNESIIGQRESTETEATRSGAKDVDDTQESSKTEKTSSKRIEQPVRIDKPREIDEPEDTREAGESDKRKGSQEAEKMRPEETSGGTEESRDAQASKPEAMGPPPEEHQQQAQDEVDDVSDASTINDDDFDWDSAMDGSAFNSESDSESDSDEDDGDPWFAICVVGLRVYSTSTETQIQVVEGIDADEDRQARGRRRTTS